MQKLNGIVNTIPGTHRFLSVLEFHINEIIEYVLCVAFAQPVFETVPFYCWIVLHFMYVLNVVQFVYSIHSPVGRYLTWLLQITLP